LKDVDQQKLRAAITRDKLLAKSGSASDAKPDNERLLRILAAIRGAVEHEKATLADLKAKLAKEASVADPKTAELLTNRAALQEAIQRRLQELDDLRAERARLESLLDEHSRKKE